MFTGKYRVHDSVSDVEDFSELHHVLPPDAKDRLGMLCQKRELVVVLPQKCHLILDVHPCRLEQIEIHSTMLAVFPQESRQFLE